MNAPDTADVTKLFLRWVPASAAFAIAALSLLLAGEAIVEDGRESRALAMKMVEEHANTVRLAAGAGIPKNMDSITNSVVTPVAMEVKNFADSSHPLALLGLGVGGLVLGLAGMSFALRRDEE